MQPLLLVSDKYRRYIENIRTVLIENGFDEFENMLYDDFTYYIEQAISNCETPTFDLTASRIKLGLFIVRNGLQIDLLGLMSQDVSLNDFNNKFNLLNNSLESKTKTLKDTYKNLVKNVVGNRLNINRFPEPEWQEPVGINIFGDLSTTGWTEPSGNIIQINNKKLNIFGDLNI